MCSPISPISQNQRLLNRPLPGWVAMAALAGLAVAACASAASVASSATAPAASTAASTPALPFAPSEMNAPEVKARLGGLVVVDVRFLVDFNQAHVPGAISMPLAEIEQRYRELPRGKPIVVYAEANDCG
ncbi:MAG: hypothetical protein HYX92_09755 [Chloroflexi bacterium]|nr:hypothetical protein [Chloroflexota bacterium]